MTQKLFALMLAVLVGFLAGGCGGGEDGDQTSRGVISDDQPTASSLREMVFDNPGSGQPSYMVAGENASLQYWMDQFGEVTQSLYKSADGTESVRTFYDPMTGETTTVLNEVSGHYLSIREYSPQRIDFWTYDSSGTYLGGFAVFEESGTYYYGEIVGVPAHGGGPITGPLYPASASWTGSFTLMGDIEDGLINVQPLPPGLTTLLNGLVPNGTVVTGAEGYSPVLAAPFTLHRAISLAGMIMMGAGIVANAPPLILAGGAGFVAAQVLPVIANAVRRQFGGDCPQDGDLSIICSELTDLAADHLANPNERSLESTTQDANAWLEEKPSRLRSLIDRGRGLLRNIIDGLSGDDEVGEESFYEPDSTYTPPTVPAFLQGSANREDGTSVSLQGNIDVDGTVNVSGTDEQSGFVEMNFAVDIDGNPVGGGTFGWGLDMGAIQDNTYRRCGHQVACEG